MHTGQPKKLNKGIIYTHLDRVQRDQQVRRGTHSQEPQARSIQGRDWLSEPRDSSFRERSLTGELVFQEGTQPTQDSFGLAMQATQMSLLGHTGR